MFTLHDDIYLAIPMPKLEANPKAPIRWLESFAEKRLAKRNINPEEIVQQTPIPKIKMDTLYPSG
jgi:hypothetical protein